MKRSILPPEFTSFHASHLVSVLGPVSDVRVLGISQPAAWLISIDNVAGAEASGR